MSSLRLRGCLGCRNFHHVCHKIPAQAGADCERYESLAEWYGRQIAWFDKAERDWIAILAMSGVVVAAAALLALML